MGYHCICLYTIPPTHSTFTLPPLNSSPGSHLWPRSMYYTTIITLHVWVTMGYHCICLYTIPPTHSTFTLPLQILTCGHGQRTTSHITPHYCYITTRLCYNGVSLYMSVYHTTYTFHLHTPSPDSHTTLLLSHYTFSLQWSIIVYVCIPYHLHIPSAHSLLLSPPQVLTCGHGQHTTSHITPYHCYYTTRMGNNEVSLYMSVYHTTYTFHLHTPSSYLLSRFSPVATVNVLHHTIPLLLHYTFVLQWGITVYICIPYHLHIPPSHSLLLSPLQILTCGNGKRTTSHHTTVITLHVWVTMRYHCICLYTIPPTHSIFTLPPLISSPGSHLWSRSTYYITYHTTSLLSHYTFVLQWGITVYICIPYHLHIPSSHSLLLSPLQVLTCGHGKRTTSHITPHHCYHITRLYYLYLNCTFWHGRQHIIAREDFSDCIPSGHRQRVHWTEKCILNRQNHNGNHMTANEALSNIIISFVKCTILYLFWYQYEF